MKIMLLQEWIGYCMTTDTSMEKMMYMRGPTRHGKGTILKVIGDLVGKDQVASPRFKKLAGQFGLQSLVGKLVCLIGDARDDKGGATLLESLEVLLSIVGRDALQVDRKFLSQVEGNSLSCRITIAANAFLNLPDTAGAMDSRLLILDFQKPVTTRDNSLKDTLGLEVQGIALWALQGLKRLRENGCFTEPASSVAALQEWKLYNNPLASFLAECTNVDLKGHVSRIQLFDCWEKWATAKKFSVGTCSQFFNDISTIATHARVDKVAVGESNEVIYRGMSVTKDAARRYLGRPN
jgi:putative DNA primase/helicase